MKKLNDWWDYPNMLIMLVGPPGSGKSTYRDYIISQREIYYDKIHVISLDAMIEETMTGSETYAEAFLRLQKSGELKEMDKKMYRDAEEYAKNKSGTLVIWDQTNLTIKSRERKIKIFDGWFKEAFVFELSKSELDARLHKREMETGKSIPEFVMKSMIDSYERPTLDEGFNYIYYV